MKGYTSKAVHGSGKSGETHKSLRPPLYDSVSFEFESAREMALAFEGKSRSHAYTRVSNPTVELLEQRIVGLSGSLGVVAVSSGMAAISNVVLSLAEVGTNLVTSRNLFSHTYDLFTRTFKRWGLETRFADMTTMESIKLAVDEKTRLIFLEVITNPQLEIADIPKITAFAAERGIPVVLDGTLTSGYLFDAKSAGVAVEVVSSTKLLSGGATGVGGLIIDTGAFSWKNHPAVSRQYKIAGPGAFIVKLRREVYRNVGSCLAPHNAWLQILGLETVALRAERMCDNALTVARYLEQHPAVNKVHYPGLESSPFHTIAKKLLPNGCGGVLTFELASFEAAYQLIDSVKMIRRSTNLSDNKTLILHPASTIFTDYSADERAAAGISEAMIRLSLGIENSEDIIDDLQQGLDIL